MKWFATHSRLFGYEYNSACAEYIQTHFAKRSVQFIALTASPKTINLVLAIEKTKHSKIGIHNNNKHYL